MKPTTIAVTVVSVLALGSRIAGRPASRPKLKYPYAGERLNQPCGKTLLEWQCATQQVRCKPLTPTKEWEITHLLAVPRPNGVLIQANIVRVKGFTDRAAHRWLHRAKEAVYKEAKQRFLSPPGGWPKPAGPIPRKDPFDGWRNCRVEIYVDGRLHEAKGLAKSKLGK